MVLLPLRSRLSCPTDPSTEACWSSRRLEREAAARRTVNHSNHFSVDQNPGSTQPQPTGSDWRSRTSGSQPTGGRRSFPRWTSRPGTAVDGERSWTAVDVVGVTQTNGSARFRILSPGIMGGGSERHLGREVRSGQATTMTGGSSKSTSANADSGGKRHGWPDPAVDADPDPAGTRWIREADRPPST